MTRDEIKYLALQELGYVKEPDFDADDDNGVNAINGVYEHIFNLALTSFDWFFCDAFTSVTSDATTNARYKYSADLPDDVLFLRGIYTDDKGTILKDYYNAKDKIFTNYATIYLRYTKKVCEEMLPPYFVEYLKYKLAAKLCQSLTGDGDLLKLMMMREEEAFNLAKNADICQRPVRYLDANAFTEVRN